MNSVKTKNMRDDGGRSGWRRCLERAVMAVALAGMLSIATSARAAKASDEVSVADSGSEWSIGGDCAPGHKFERRLITFDNGVAQYGFLYSGCSDPSHGDLRPSHEGNFGMPLPSPANWYHGGFFFVSINAAEATNRGLRDLQVIERGQRGAMQIVWTHPDAEVGLRLLMLPGVNHVLAELVLRPKSGAVLKSVVVRLRCYPSFFTACYHRRGQRHCQTPRIDRREPSTLKIAPDRDTWLYMYDTVFDVANGEGDGPCAVAIAPGAVDRGQVDIGDYAVTTELTLKPGVNRLRLAFYDFTGSTNAVAAAYMKTHADEDIARLVRTDFHPRAAQGVDVERVEAEATRLLAAAGDGGKPLKARVDELIGRINAAKAKTADDDWKAEGDMANLVASLEDMLWKLKIEALLNQP